jgi:hypothetical protein
MTREQGYDDSNMGIERFLTISFDGKKTGYSAKLREQVFLLLSPLPHSM